MAGGRRALQRNLPAVTEIEMPVPDMDVAVAHPGGLHPQYDFRPLRLGVRIVAGLELFSPLDDLHCAHRFSFFGAGALERLGCCHPSAWPVALTPWMAGSSRAITGAQGLVNPDFERICGSDNRPSFQRYKNVYEKH